MQFDCFDLDNLGKFIGHCTLSIRQYDLVGTEHRFGDTDYVLIETRIGDKCRMYFRRKKV